MWVSAIATYFGQAGKRLLPAGEGKSQRVKIGPT